MILIIGGAFQGKYEYAADVLNIPVEDILDGLQDRIKDDPDEESCIKAVDEWIEKHKDGAVICDEVGCGIVPINAADRDYRDRVGHIQIYLAKKADAVYRVTCGIGVRIK